LINEFFNVSANFFFSQSELRFPERTVSDVQDFVAVHGYRRAASIIIAAIVVVIVFLHFTPPKFDHIIMAAYLNLKGDGVRVNR
jgi:uncharacterized membrane protein